MARWPGVLGGAGVVWSSGSSQVREEGGWESGCHTGHRGRTVKGAVLSGEGGVLGGHYSQGERAVGWTFYCCPCLQSTLKHFRKLFASSATAADIFCNIYSRAVI